MKTFNDDLSPPGVVIKGTWYCTDIHSAKSIEDRLHCFFDFARERHAIFLRRKAGEPKPWTNDPFLSSFRFCNIYRELDTVSQWIKNEVIIPYEDDPNLWFMLCASRIINWPDSLAELMSVKGGFGINGQYSPKIAFDVLMDRRARHQKTITGAYIVNSVTTEKDPDTIRGNKLAYIAYRTLGEIWKDRKLVEGNFKSTLELAVDTLKKYRGYGPFMAYQIVVDLSYSKKWLAKAPDYNTYNSAGPGTRRGLSRIFHGEKNVPMSDEEKTRLLSFQLKASQNPNYWPNTSKDISKGFAPLSMSNLSNCNCETDKYFRLFLGQGKPRSRYDGTGYNQLSLF